MVEKPSAHVSCWMCFSRSGTITSFRSGHLNYRVTHTTTALQDKQTVLLYSRSRTPHVSAGSANLFWFLHIICLVHIRNVGAAQCNLLNFQLGGKWNTNCIVSLFPYFDGAVDFYSGV